MTSLGPRLRHRVAVQASTTYRDTNGDRVQEWADVAGLENVPAEVLTGAGREAQAAGQDQTIVAARVTVRWQSALAAPRGMRIVHGSAIYHIETFYTDATGRRWLTLVCSEGARDG